MYMLAFNTGSQNDDRSPTRPLSSQNESFPSRTVLYSSTMACLWVDSGQKVRCIYYFLSLRELLLLCDVKKKGGRMMAYSHLIAYRFNIAESRG